MNILPTLDDKSVDMVFCDLPYGTTACEWDSIIPLAELWEQYRRICKGAIVLTATEPFTSKLIMSNPEMFKHKWVWNKKLAGNFVQAKRMPLRICEDVIMFSNGNHTYNPQMEKHDKPYMQNRVNSAKSKAIPVAPLKERKLMTEKYPTDLVEFSFPRRDKSRFHPTQKPVNLIEYFIKTYSNEGDMVLDNCMGSGSTGIACKSLNRQFIGIEQNTEYFTQASTWLNS